MKLFFRGFSSSLWYSDMYRYFIGVRTGCACVGVIPPHLWRHFPLYSSVLHNDEKFSLLQNPYLFYRFPRSSVCLSQFWSDVKLVGFCLCNVSMVRLYFVFSEYYGVSVHDESPSLEIWSPLAIYVRYDSSGLGSCRVHFRIVLVSISSIYS